MPAQLTIRNVSPALSERLKALAAERELSMNATVLAILERAVGIDARRQWLLSFATWADEKKEEFDAELRAQRVIDESDWE